MSDKTLKEALELPWLGYDDKGTVKRAIAHYRKLKRYIGDPKYIVVDTSDDDLITSIEIREHKIIINQCAVVVDWNDPGVNFENSLFDWTIYEGTESDIDELFSKYAVYAKVDITLDQEELEQFDNEFTRLFKIYKKSFAT